MDDLEARVHKAEAERDALRRQLAQAEALQEISQALTSTLNLEQVLTLILELAGRVISYDSASVLLVTPDRNGAIIAAARGFQVGDALVGKSFSFEEGNISAQVVSSRRPLVVDDVQQHPGWARKRVDIEGATTIRSWIGTPLVVDEESIGLVTFDKHTPGFYSSKDTRAASAFAAQAALAVRNARLFEEAQRRAEEMTTLQQVGLDLAEQTETLEAVLDILLERMRNLFHADNGKVWLWNESLKALELVTYQAGSGPDMHGARLRPGEGFNGQVFESGQPMILDDYALWAGRLDTWKEVSQRAVMGVPMFWQGSKIGTISVAYTEPTHRFGKDNIRLLGLLANHAAAAIANARLLGETRRRLNELEALNEIGRAIGSTIRLDALMELIYRQSGRLMDTTNFYIALYDGARHWIEFAIEVEEGQRLPQRGRAFAGGLTEHILNTRQPLFLPDSQQVQVQSKFGIRPLGRIALSWLGVPMIAGDHAIGVIAVQSYEREYAYDEHDLRVLSTIAAQASVAVQNARLYEAEQQRVAELESRQRQLGGILRVGNLLRADLSPETISQYIAQAAQVATGFGVALVSLVEGDPPVCRRVASTGIEPEIFARLQQTPQALVRLEGFLREEFRISQSYFIPYEKRPPELSSELSLYVSPIVESDWDEGRWHPRDILIVPLRDKDGGIIGSLSMDEPADGLRPLLATIETLEVFANQASAALQNARLYEAEQHRIRELEIKQHQLAAILRVGNLLRADLSLEDILQRVAQAAREATGFNVALFSLIEDDPPVLRRVSAVGLLPEVFEEFRQTAPSMSVMYGLMQDEFCISQSYFLPHERSGEWDHGLNSIVTMDEREGWRPGQWHPDDALFTPLLDRTGQVIGTLSVDDPADGCRPTQATIEILEIFANQASVAVQNSRLYHAARQQATRLTLINQVARQTTGTLALDELLDTVVQSIRSSFGYQEVGVLLRKNRELVLRAAAGEAFEKVAGQFRTQIGQGLTGWAAEHEQTVIVGDTQSDPRYFAVDSSTCSEVVVPLIASGEVLGVLNVESDQPNAFTHDDVMGLETIADQLAGAITNARLYASAQRHAEELRQQKTEIELLYKVSSELSATLDAEMLLGRLLPLAVSTIGAMYGSVFLLDEEGRVTHHLITRQDLSSIEARQVAQTVLEHGLAGWVYQQAQPALVADARADSRWISLPGSPYEPVGSVLCAPLCVRGIVRGVLTLLHVEPLYFAARHQRTLVAIAQQAATALENIYLYEREYKRAEQLALLHRVSTAVSSSLDIKEVLQIATARLAKLFDVDHCGMVLFDSKLSYGQLLAEYPPSGIAGLRFPLDEDRIESELIETKQPVYVADVGEDARLGPTTRATMQGTDVISTLLVPLVVKGRIIGSFGLDARKLPRAFRPEEIELSQTIAAQIAVAVDNARLYEESVTRVEQEMAIARHIQQNLFPREVPKLRGLQIAAVCRPARETGGDFYEFVRLGERKLGIIVGDVSGKGLPAAMLMAAARSTARARAQGPVSPAGVLSEVNRLLCDDVPQGAFVAMSYAIVDLERNELVVSNGGQIFPLRLPSGEEVIYIEPPGPNLPLGVSPQLQYSQVSSELLPGDTVLFVTDGVLEAHDPTRELFSFERLETLVNLYSEATVEDLMSAVLQSVDAFARETEQHDDITIVVIRRI